MNSNFRFADWHCQTLPIRACACLLNQTPINVTRLSQRGHCLGIVGQVVMVMNQTQNCKFLLWMETCEFRKIADQFKMDDL